MEKTADLLDLKIKVAEEGLKCLAAINDYAIKCISEVKGISEEKVINQFSKECELFTERIDEIINE